MAGEQRICPVCGKAFGNKRRKYCTPECTRKANKKKAVEYSRKEYGKMKRKRQAERKELENHTLHQRETLCRKWQGQQKRRA